MVKHFIGLLELTAAAHWAFLATLVTGDAPAQVLVGDHLHFACGLPPTSLVTVQSPGVTSGAPQIVDVQALLVSPYSTCWANECNGGSFRDRQGFLWTLGECSILKLVPPPIATGSRLVFSVDLCSTNIGDLGTPKPPLLFDRNGNAYALCRGNDSVGRIVRIDPANGNATLLFVLPDPEYNRSLVLFDNGISIEYYYTHSSSLRRIHRVGGQWRNETVRANFVRVIEGPSDTLIGYGPNAQIEILDRYSAATLSTYGGPTTFSDALLILSGSNHELWYETSDHWLHRVIILPDRTFVSGQTLAFLPNPTGGGITSFALDALGRVIATNYDYMFYTNETRDALLGSMVICGGVYPARYIGPSIAGGDPNGLRRAITVDKDHDDDGDGWSNYEEVRLGSAPFDPQRTPLASPPTMHCTPSAQIGTSFTLTLIGRTGSGFVLAQGRPATQPISYPGFVGFLELDPGTINVFLAASPSLPISIPPGGRFQLIFGVPNNPVLSGLQIYFQGVTWSMEPRSTGFTNRAAVVFF